MESANAIINNAIEALQREAEVIQAKISALENSLTLSTDGIGEPTKPRRGRPKKAQPQVELPLSAIARSKVKSSPALTESESDDPNDKLQAAAEKRSKSWDAAKKAAAAERMRRYWAERKKQG